MSGPPPDAPLRLAAFYALVDLTRARTPEQIAKAEKKHDEAIAALAAFRRKNKP